MSLESTEKREHGKDLVASFYGGCNFYLMLYQVPPPTSLLFIINLCFGILPEKKNQIKEIL